jgi:hypothetical protein
MGDMQMTSIAAQARTVLTSVRQSDNLKFLLIARLAAALSTNGIK